MVRLDCQIEEIMDSFPDLYLNHCAIMAVALMRSARKSSARFRVACHGFLPDNLDIDEFDLRVGWERATNHAAIRMARSEQIRPMVERGAVALAALLFARLMAGGPMEVCRHGDRADYWLPRRRAALEVSGTMVGSKLERRFRLKQRQALENNVGWDGYAVVCSFDPARREILWGYRTKEEQS